MPPQRTEQRLLSYQAVAVAERHFAGVRLILEVSRIMAVGRVRVTPGQAASLPVLHPELAGEQTTLQRQVQQEVVTRCGQLVEELRERKGVQ